MNTQNKLLMNDDVKWAIIGVVLGVFSIYLWYKTRKIISFRDPIMVIFGIFLICFGLIVLLKNLITYFTK